MFDHKEVGRKIKKARKEKKLTQRQLAERCNMSPSHISNIENGNRLMTIDVLYILCEELNLSPSYLLYGKVSETDKRIIFDLNSLNTRDTGQITRFIKAVNVLADGINHL